jgi:S-DNA-T family DNA segregation ATPase FtsK/SpoIIIE
VLDEMGADKLLGNGDMLFLSPGTSTMLRGQGTFLSDDEITRVVDFVGVDDPQFAGELMQLKTKEEVEAAANGGGNFQSKDDLYEAAVDVVVRERRGSCSLLQRALGIGYGRAARLIDFMAEDGVVGQYNGSQARDVLISMQDWESRLQGGGENVTTAQPVAVAGGGIAKPRPTIAPPDRLTIANVQPARRNKIVPKLDEPSDLEEEDEYEEEEEAEADDQQWDEEEEAEETDQDVDGDEELAEDEEWEDEDEDESTDEESEEDEEELDEDEEGEYDEEEWDEDGSEEDDALDEEPVSKNPSARPKR